MHIPGNPINQRVIFCIYYDMFFILQRKQVRVKGEPSNILVEMIIRKKMSGKIHEIIS